ncbi:MAG: MarR family transcriptional regulator [Chloroflexi bacterium]|jgi:hypothetical protein|nr:MarR family transcriptional regulator [Chloroflexota bacterium]
MAKKGEQSGDASVVLEKQLLQSAAFRALSGKAPQVLMLFMTKRQMKQDNTRRGRWYIANDGRIRFTYIEAEDRWEIPRSTFMRALNELQEKGFLDVTLRGAGISGSANLYSLSNRWKKWGTDTFELPTKPTKKNKHGFAPGHRRY